MPLDMPVERLLIDIGNTTLGYCHESDLKQKAHVSLPHGNYEIKNLLEQIYSEKAFDEILLASVYKPDLTEDILQWSKAKKLPCQVAASQSKKHGLVNGYTDFEQLGVDRWLAMLSIWSETRSAFFLISSGTAMTFDMVDDQGAHQGGIIIPGYEMMQSCLKKGTVGIDNTDQNNRVFWGLAKNTGNALANGSLMAISSVIDNLIVESGLETRQGFITGGDAKLINSYRQKPLQIIENTVLKGLVRAFEDDAA